MFEHRLRRCEAVDISALGDEPRALARLALNGAATGDAHAQALLAQLLLDGHGIEADPRLALSWFRIAAARGHAMASNMAGRCLEHGWGCRADVAEAATFYRRAAALGLDWGCYNLANLLATGRGVPQDMPAANVEISVIPGGNRYRDELGAIRTRTDAGGKASITWPEAGMYWLQAELTTDQGVSKPATERRASYSATLEVLAQ